MDFLQIGTLTDIDLGQGQLDIITNQYFLLNKQVPHRKGKAICAGEIQKNSKDRL